MKALSVSACGTVCALAVILAGTTPVGGAERSERLLGGNENPPVVSDGTGRFGAVLRKDRIDFKLRYDVSNVTQAHVHIANPGNNGGIAAFLCSNLGNAPSEATQACPPSPTRVEGEILAADVLEVLDGTTVVLAAGDLEGLILLMRQGATYANVHTEDHPAGEVRGQVNPRER